MPGGSIISVAGIVSTSEYRPPLFFLMATMCPMAEVAVSQQAGVGGMGYAGREYDSSTRRPSHVRSSAACSPTRSRRRRSSTSTAPPASRRGSRSRSLGKRLYNDELKLVEESADGRRRYEIYGFEPSHEDEEGTDLNVVADGSVSITPVHFELTDHGEMEELRGLGHGGSWAPTSGWCRRRVSPGAAGPRHRAAGADRRGRSALLRARRPDPRRRRVRRPDARAAGA